MLRQFLIAAATSADVCKGGSAPPLIVRLCSPRRRTHSRSRREELVPTRPYPRSAKRREWGGQDATFSGEPND
jgi:hypothetical protein